MRISGHTVLPRLPACWTRVIPIVSIVMLTAFSTSGQNKANCPQIISSLLPANGSIRGGEFTMAGSMGMGHGVADLPFKHPCLETTTHPARVSIAVWYYGDELATLLEMQGDAADQQTLSNASHAFEKTGNPVRSEEFKGGRILYCEWKSECPAEGAAGKGIVERPPIPGIRLIGVARTANVRLELTLDGQISADSAKAAVAEIFEKLKKADFRTK